MTNVPESKVAAVFGAGPGLGASAARLFGARGYRVALVARTRERLEAQAEYLGRLGIEAAAFPADLSRPADVPDLVEAITARFGRIDVVQYAPITAASPFTPAAGLTVGALEGATKVYLFTPVALVGAVLPGMRARGDGAILLGQGGTSAVPAAGRSGVPAVMAATRHWVHTLHEELAPEGIYAGVLTISALIRGSAGGRDIPVDPAGPAWSDPDDLAAVLWDMATRRDTAERRWPR